MSVLFFSFTYLFLFLYLLIKYYVSNKNKIKSQKLLNKQCDSKILELQANLSTFLLTSWIPIALICDHLNFILLKYLSALLFAFLCVYTQNYIFLINDNLYVFLNKIGTNFSFVYPLYFLLSEYLDDLLVISDDINIKNVVLCFYLLLCIYILYDTMKKNNLLGKN